MSHDVPISNCQLSAAAAHWLLQQLGEEQLYHILQNIGPLAQSWFRGFTLSRHTCGQPAVRNRIQNALVRMPQVAEGFLKFPGTPWHVWCEILPAFEPNWLRKNWRALLRRPEGRLPAVVLALAPNEPLRRRGLRLLRRTHFWEAPPTPKPGVRHDPRWQALGRLLGTVEAMPAVPGAGGVAPAAAAPEEGGPVGDRLRKGLEESRKRLEKAKSQLAEAEKRHQAELEQGKAERQQLQAELRGAREETRQLLATLEERLAERIQAYRREVLGLTPEFEQAVAQALAAAPDLESKVEALLARQRELNERHAKLEAVRAEVARLRGLAARLDTAVRDGAAPVPGLEALRTEIRNRIASLLRLPGVDSPADWPPVALALRRRIEAAPPDEGGRRDLEPISQALEREPLCSLVDAYRAAELQDLIRHRLARLRELHQERELAAALALPPR